MLLQMALFHSFLWLSDTPLYIYTTSSLSIHLSMDLRGLFFKKWLTYCTFTRLLPSVCGMMSLSVQEFSKLGATSTALCLITEGLQRGPTGISPSRAMHFFATLDFNQ